MQNVNLSTVNCNGNLISWEAPQVMGILNVTPDSFFDGGKYHDINTVRQRVADMLSEGVDIIDVGAYSSRPGADNISEEEEIGRLKPVLELLSNEFSQIPISLDTFRSGVAKWAIEKYSVPIINDISGGDLDPELPKVVAKYQVIYIIMHMQGNPQDMQLQPHYNNVVAEVIKPLQEKIIRYQKLGIKDLVVDPGFGFGKTLNHNYTLLSHLKTFNLLNKPILVGVSRKSMLYKLLDSKPEGVLNATSIVNTVSLLAGANILRVHDVKEARECVQIIMKLKQLGISDKLI